MKRSFVEQFRECSKKELVGIEELECYKDHPEYLPHPIPSHKTAKKVAKILKKGPNAGLTPCMCLKFNNGKCWSGNLKCKKLRGL